MKSYLFAGLCVVLSLGAVMSADPPKMPEPEKEHHWLKALNGQWALEGECFMEPGKPIKCTGSASCKSLGGFWVMSEMKTTMGGMEMNGVMTLGYDAAKKKFVGTWVADCCPNLWSYEGTVDSTGKILTLEADGPNPMTGKNTKWRDIIEFKSDEHKLMKSEMLGEDGKWVQCMSLEFKKKK